MRVLEPNNGKTDTIDQLLDESIETDRNTLLLADDDMMIDSPRKLLAAVDEDEDFDLVYMSDFLKN